ncbi:amino acid permease [Actibacterium mucosum KCTC 23349]|uniref:Amino acid permease n=1 Tax=Actibacterium mucosum KCTC 23349 TaxID=1454373 RepID=A0A037ZJL9_9RHOB|nr:amino acid permease [Actibacterium mucosum]KAJ55752.1 amino acid permease [Actibacterium mucosum KCTC 23349]
MTQPSDHLKRRIGLPLLTAYGVGVMVGAGIYVLVGVVAGSAGVWAPLAFLLAGIVALPSALSYAELSARMPVAAGEAVFVEAGFQSRPMAVIVGLAVVVAGTISAAAVLRGGVGYLTGILDVPAPWAMIAIGVLLTAVAVVGVLESLAFAAVFTAIEVIGLVMVSWAGFTAPPVAEWITPPAPEFAGIAGAVALCFFAFIGFEDLENMAEEVRDPTRVMPRGILLALIITAVLYALVSLAAVRAVPADQLGQSGQPLALVWQAGQGGSAAFLSAIAVAAAVNGVLAQIVMAARVLFGLGRQFSPLAGFTTAHPRFGTPVRATILVGAAVILGALALPVEDLARATSAVLLAVFFLVNVALILLKRRAPQAPFRVPTWVPWLGVVAAATALTLAFGTGH